mmetsp:Transcript_26839/g.62898  ORF Transcript_26839/g.62898 Transcript_26839/m.62898 type:complete len:93 (+) Transcript_26839:60-338(+)|eukprot:s1041_g1.t1
MGCEGSKSVQTQRQKSFCEEDPLSSLAGVQDCEGCTEVTEKEITLALAVKRMKAAQSESSGSSGKLLVSMRKKRLRQSRSFRANSSASVCAE